MRTKTALLYILVGTLAIAACRSPQRAEQDSDTVTVEQEDRGEGILSSGDSVIIEVVTQFVAAYNAQDNGAVNAFIHPDQGLIIVHRPGAVDWFEKVEKIDFGNPVPSYHAYDSATHSYPLRIASLPTYACETESWNKEGLYVDTLGTTNILQPIATHLDEFDDVELDTDYEADIEQAESGSYRVVLTSETPLVFHIKEIDGTWYVTILDRAYGDCSA